jgi:hypothetical protein
MNAETIVAMREATRIDVDAGRWPARNERGAEDVGRLDRPRASGLDRGAVLSGRACMTLLASVVLACGGKAPTDTCRSSAECGPGRVCVDERCVTTRDDAGADAALDAGADAGPSECAAPCTEDSRCVGGECVPWAEGEAAPCEAPRASFAVSPRILCHWPRPGVALDEGPEAWRWARRVTSTLVAGSFLPSTGEFEDPPTWLVFATGSGLNTTTEVSVPSAQQRGGVLRVLDAQSCALVDTLDEVPVASWFQPPALGDLDGDGVPEIVAQAWDDRDPLGSVTMAYQGSGRLVAWKWNAELGRFRVWRQSTVAGAPEADLAYTAGYVMMAGPSIADLDDDGAPEVLLAGRVYDRELRRLSGQAPPSAELFLSRQPPAGPYVIQQDVVADLDRDGRAELVYGHGIFTWSGDRWTPASFFSPPTALGLAHGVVADLGELSGSAAGQPEVIAIGYDGVRIQTTAGAVLRRFDLPTSERGPSAPSLADVDGDGQLEILVGLDRGLFVYDLECDVDAPSAECGRDTVGGADPLPRGVRWADRPPADNWDYMGATTFDFDGDGDLEVVYADECFLRIYDGASGEVLYSHWRPSRTASEVPIVVGTNGGADTVVAIGLHTARFCGQATGVGDVPPYDPQFPGLSCASDRDCFGAEGSCRAGRCRCAVDADCCGPGADCRSLGFACHPAPPSDPNGNTCRAVRVPDTSEFARDGVLEEGVDLLTDAFGRWGPARTVWNQDAYQVTNVGDEGTIPRTRDVVLPTSFRSNVASTARAARAADLRARRVVVECGGGTPRALGAEVCNRGTRSASAGQQVHFEGVDGERLCEAVTLDVVAPGDCVAVRCELADSAVSSASVVAIVNPEQRTPECGSAEENVSAPAALGCE